MAIFPIGTPSFLQPVTLSATVYAKSPHFSGMGAVGSGVGSDFSRYASSQGSGRFVTVCRFCMKPAEACSCDEMGHNQGTGPKGAYGISNRSATRYGRQANAVGSKIYGARSIPGVSSKSPYLVPQAAYGASPFPSTSYGVNPSASDVSRSYKNN